MSIFSRICRSVLGIFFVISFLTVFGCPGTGTNNDQGTSFLATGFFVTGAGDQGDSGQIVFLNVDSATQIAASQISNPLFVPATIGDEGLERGFIGLENRLTAQFIRTIGANCSYTVPGSDPTFEIPDDSYFFTTVLGPAASATQEAAASEGLPNTVFVQIVIVSASNIATLSVNKNRLPALPFRMLVECDVTGVTQAGDTITTNVVNYQVIFAELPECCAAGTSDPGFQIGAGTGGDFAGTTFGDAEFDEDSTDNPATGAVTSGGSSDERETATGDSFAGSASIGGGAS